MLLEYQDRRIYRFAETHWLGVDITDGGALRLGAVLALTVIDCTANWHLIVDWNTPLRTSQVSMTFLSLSLSKKRPLPLILLALLSFSVSGTRRPLL